MKMEYFILDVLQGKLELDGEPVRLIQAPPNYNNIPCLTIDNSAGARTLNSNKYNIPTDDGMREAIVTEYEIDLRLDIWVLNEKDRQSLINQVNTLFYQALSDHYQYCTSYMNGECECIVQDYPDDKRGSKHQCPNPHDYPYENLWTKYDIDQSTFTINPAYDLDQLNETEPILRSRLDITFNYKDEYIIGGTNINKIQNQT